MRRYDLPNRYSLPFTIVPTVAVTVRAVTRYLAQVAPGTSVDGSEQIQVISQIKSPTIRRFDIRSSTYHTHPPYRSGNAVRKHLRNSRGVLLRTGNTRSSYNNPAPLNAPPTVIFAQDAIRSAVRITTESTMRFVKVCSVIRHTK